MSANRMFVRLLMGKRSEPTFETRAHKATRRGARGHAERRRTSARTIGVRITAVVSRKKSVAVMSALRARRCCGRARARRLGRSERSGSRPNRRSRSSLSATRAAVGQGGREARPFRRASRPPHPRGTPGGARAGRRRRPRSTTPRATCRGRSRTSVSIAANTASVTTTRSVPVTGSASTWRQRIRCAPGVSPASRKRESRVRRPPRTHGIGIQRGSQSGERRGRWRRARESPDGRANRRT